MSKSEFLEDPHQREQWRRILEHANNIMGFGKMSKEEQEQIVKIANLIRALRMDANLSISYLADVSDTDPHLIVFLESGLVTKDEMRENIEGLAEALGQDPDIFINNIPR